MSEQMAVNTRRELNRIYARIGSECQRAGCTSEDRSQPLGLAGVQSVRLCDACRDEWDAACEAMPEWDTLQNCIRHQRAVEIAMDGGGEAVVEMLEMVARSVETARSAMRQAVLHWLGTPRPDGQKDGTP